MPDGRGSSALKTLQKDVYKRQAQAQAHFRQTVKPLIESGMFPAYIAETALPQFINKLAEIIIPEKRTALSLQDKMRQFILPLPQNSVLKLLSQLSLYLFIPLSRSFIDIDFPADAAIICAVRGRALEPFKIIRFSRCV